jgi:hypothetical protein
MKTSVSAPSPRSKVTSGRDPSTKDDAADAITVSDASSELSVSVSLSASSDTTVSVGRGRRVITAPRKLADFQTAAAGVVTSPARQREPTTTVAAAAAEQSQPGGQEEAGSRREKRKRVVKTNLSEVNDGDESPFCGFTDEEIEQALSVRSSSGSLASVLSAVGGGRVRREPKLPRKLADFAVSSSSKGIIGGPIVGETSSKDAVVETKKAAEEVLLDTNNQLTMPVVPQRGGGGSSRRKVLAVTVPVLHSNKRGRKKRAPIIPTAASLTVPADAPVAIKTKGRGSSQLLSDQASEKENKTIRQGCGYGLI